MKLLPIAVIAAFTVGAAQPRDRAPDTEFHVAVCASLGTLAPADANLIRFATQRSSKIFAAIGVALDWRVGRCDDSSDAIRIGFQTETPESTLPLALAYAQLYEGIHVVVFHDRVGSLAKSSGTPTNCLLAYVFVHEITHILQGVNRHESAGIMKARWNCEDRFKMRTSTLGFTDYDVELIYLGHRPRKLRGTDERSVNTALR